MHELEVLLNRLKMEHLSYHVESLLEQAAKKELNYREFLCMALQQEWSGRHQRGMESVYESHSFYYSGDFNKGTCSRSVIF